MIFKTTIDRWAIFSAVLAIDDKRVVDGKGGFQNCAPNHEHSFLH